MVPFDKKICSNLTPIAKIKSLASKLSITEEELINISNSIDKLWKPGKLLYKKNGDPRPTINAKPQLKQLHEKIKNRLLKQVDYPTYLLGGIADSASPRDYKRHAAIHSGKQILISEDIKDFFPNTSYDIVYNIWKYIFQCTPEVAEILTKITILNGELPQGWKTSGYLANLALWDREPDLVEQLTKRGFTYSRFMDDITVSCKSKITKKQMSYIISMIYGMLFSKGYTPKRSKHQIATSINRMEVTGLTVNSKKPTLPNKNKIRSAVHLCETKAKYDRTSNNYKTLWRQTSGKVGTHPNKGKKLRERLTAIKHYNFAVFTESGLTFHAKFFKRPIYSYITYTKMATLVTANRIFFLDFLSVIP